MLITADKTRLTQKKAIVLMAFTSFSTPQLTSRPLKLYLAPSERYPPSRQVSWTNLQLMLLFIFSAKTFPMQSTATQGNFS